MSSQPSRLSSREANGTSENIPSPGKSGEGPSEWQGRDLNANPAATGHSSATSTTSNLPDSIRSVFHEVYGRELILVQHPAGDRWMDEAEVTGSDF